MARVLGYGGLANTNGARDFSGKSAQVADSGFTSRWFLRCLLLLGVG